MASLVIRNLDEQTKQRLKVRAAKHNTSMEEEARRILRMAVSEDEDTAACPEGLGTAIWKLFQPGGLDLQLPPREPGPAPPDFSE